MKDYRVDLRHNPLSPDEDFVVVFRVTNERGHDNSRLAARHRLYRVDATAVEQIKVAGLHFNLVLLNVICGGEFVERLAREMRTDLGSPRTPVDDGMRAPAMIQRVLKADKTGKLMFKS